MTWDDVIAKTPSITGMPGGGPGSRPKTVYKVWHKGKMYESSDITATGPVTYSVGGYVGSRSTEHPEIHIAELKNSAQVERFQRLHPGSTSLELYHQEQVDLAKRALSDDDKVALGSPTDYQQRQIIDVLEELPLSRITDPDLQKLIRLRKTMSPTAARAAALGIAITSNDPLFATLVKRYPLMSIVSTYQAVHHLNEILLYVEAKYLMVEESSAARKSA